jgi:hypothetical protein
MTSLRFLGALVVAAIGSTTAAAASLQYDMHPGDLACPSAARFADEVTAKLGFSPWDGAGLAVKVTIDAQTGRYTGHLVYERDRDREFRGDTCDRVADLLVTATAIALDRTDPLKAAVAAASARTATTATITINGPVSGLYGTTPVRVATADSPPPRADELVLPANPATEWAFAERNDHFQLGAGMDSIAGTFNVSGAIPLSRGHFDVAIGHSSSNADSVTLSQSNVQALYMWPVFYINKNSSFEMPIYAGGGASYDWYSTSGNGMNNPSGSKIIPELAISEGLQFRKLPVEFMFAMSLALADPPNGGSNFGVDVALRYVFRGH